MEVKYVGHSTLQTTSPKKVLENLLVVLNESFSRCENKMAKRASCVNERELELRAPLSDWLGLAVIVPTCPSISWRGLFARAIHDKRTILTAREITRVPKRMKLESFQSRGYLQSGIVLGGRAIYLWLLRNPNPLQNGDYIQVKHRIHQWENQINDHSYSISSKEHG